MQYGFANSPDGPYMYAIDPVENSAIEAAPVEEQAAEASTRSAPASHCGAKDNSGWSDQCYVYRGGRDPKTGLAYTQL